LATIQDIQVLERGKKLVQEKTQFRPSAIAANPAVKGEFAVGSEVPPPFHSCLLADRLRQDTKVYIYTHSGDTIRLKKTLTSTRASVTALAYSPQGNFLAVGDSSGKILLYSVSRDEYALKTSRWAFHVSRVTALAFNAAGTHCISGSLDTNVYVWSTADVGKYIAIKNASKDGVWGVGWVHEGQVVSVGGDASVKIWDVSGGIAK
jgi:WD repeat-containing protein 1 (actin-interacting protein 1)